MSNRLVWIAAGVGALLLVGAIAAGIATFVVGRISPDKAAPAETETAAAGHLPEGPIVGLPKFVTNLAEPGTAIDVTFALVLRDEKQMEEIEKQKPVLRDTILSVIRAMKPADVAGPNGKENLAQSVLARLQELLGDHVVERVLVTDLVTHP